MNAGSELKRAIDQLHSGMTPSQLETWKHDALALLAALEKVGQSNRGESLHLRLSPREREVMNLILEAHRLKEIAARLKISAKTVTTHRARLLRKLKVKDNLGLYRYALRQGLIPV